MAFAHHRPCRAVGVLILLKSVVLLLSFDLYASQNYALPINGVNQTYSPLRGYTMRKYFSNDRCDGIPFFEAIEHLGECLLSYDTSGEKIIGSNARYYCHDKSCYDYERYSSDDDGSSSAPSSSANESSSAPLNDSISSWDVTALPDTQLEYYDNSTYIELLMEYPTTNCEGNYATTYITVYTQPEDIIHSGKCMKSTLENGQFANASYTLVFIEGSNLPQFSIQGYRKKIYENIHACSGLGNTIYELMYPIGQCVPGDLHFNKSGSSFRYVNNYDWITRYDYPSSPTCDGPGGKSKMDLTVRCHPSDTDMVPTLNRNKLWYAFYSTDVTSSAPADLVAFVREFQMLWYAEISIASLAAACSLAMILLIWDQRKWTDFNCILFALSITQLLYDATFLADPKYRNVVVMEIYSAEVDVAGQSEDMERYKKYMIINFLQQFLVNVSLLISNILSFIVVYIVIYQRSFKIKTYLNIVIVMAIIFTVAFVPSMVLLLLQLSQLYNLTLFSYDQREDNTIKASVLSVIHGIKLASICLNALCVTAVLFNNFSIQSACSWLRGGGESSRSKKASLTSELVKRLGVYPVLQILTQFPALWDQYEYQAKTRTISDKGALTDDNFYKTPAYRWCWILMFVVVPSAGIWYIVAYLWLSKDIQKKLMRRVGVGMSMLSFSSKKNSVSGIFRSGRSTSGMAMGGANGMNTDSEPEPVHRAPTFETEIYATHRADLNVEVTDVIPPDNDSSQLAYMDEQELTDMLDVENGYEPEVAPMATHLVPPPNFDPSFSSSPAFVAPKRASQFELTAWHRDSANADVMSTANPLSRPPGLDIPSALPRPRFLPSPHAAQPSLNIERDSSNSRRLDHVSDKRTSNPLFTAYPRPPPPQSHRL